MSRVQAFDPDRCCSTGVGGPEVDPALVRFAADLEWLPEATPVHEARSLQADLARAGIAPFGRVVNQGLTPVVTRDPVLSARRVSGGGPRDPPIRWDRRLRLRSAARGASTRGAAAAGARPGARAQWGTSPTRVLAMRSHAASFAFLALLASGCTVVGQGKGAKPAWKDYVDEHAVSSAPFTLRSGAVEVRLEAVVAEEHHTAFGKSRWLNVVKGSVVNLGAGPLLWKELTDGFRIRTRSGADTRGFVSMVGRAGWRRQAGTSEPDQLPSGAAGEIRVQAEPGQGGVRDDPVAITFRGRTVELR